MDYLKKIYILIICILTTSKAFNRTWNKTCPIGCVCDSRLLHGYQKYVDCSNLNLALIPSTLPLNAEILIMRNNSISMVMQTTFLPDLQFLDLSYNDLRGLHDELVFEHLKILNLSHNSLEALKYGVFDKITTLEELNASNNKIHEIHPGALYLPNLIKLDLGFNQLTTIQHYYLKDLTDLKELILTQNSITRLHNDDFEKLVKLEHLILSHNDISKIEGGTFAQIKFLKTLDLSSNSLKEVPREALRNIRSSGKISLANNPISKLGPGDFSAMKVSEIDCSHMADITMIEIRAFENLPYITILNLNNNRKLTYIASGAFHNLTTLREIYLHGNNLVAIDIIPLITVVNNLIISIYGNQLLCEYNAFWIKQIKLYRNTTFARENETVCTFVRNNISKLIKELNGKDLPARISPYILPLFPPSSQTLLGANVSFDCRAVGSPVPKVRWVSPSGKIIDENTKDNKTFFSRGTLFMRHLQNGDEGGYRCQAYNAMGFMSQEVTLIVQGLGIHLFPIAVTSTFVTLTWNDSRYDPSIKYNIQWRDVKSDSYETVNVGNYVRSYTISKLTPNTKYEFCITLHDITVIKIGCIFVNTQHADFMKLGVQRSYVTIIIVSFTFGSLILICLTLIVWKFCQHRKIRRDSMSRMFLDSIDNIPETAPITYVNIAAESMSEDGSTIGDSYEDVSEHWYTTTDLYLDTL